MEDMLISKTLDWVEANIGNSTTKQEVVSKAKDSNLPKEAKQAIDLLPDEKYSKPQLMVELREVLIGEIGAADMAMRGYGGSM